MNIIPQIVDIVSIKDYTVVCCFNNGEYRIVDFKKIIENPQSEYDKKLVDLDIFSSVYISDGNLAFKKLKISFILNKKRKFSYYSIGGDTLYNESTNTRIELPIGTKIKHLRLRNNLTQEELAIRIKTSKSSLSTIERNKHYPDIKTLEKIANCFGKKVNIEFTN